MKQTLLPQTYLIAGDDHCQCIKWRDCQWSKVAVLSVKDLAKESDEFKQVQTILRQNTCGDDPENHFVNCCGPDQKPSEIDPFSDHYYLIGNPLKLYGTYSKYLNVVK